MRLARGLDGPVGSSPIRGTWIEIYHTSHHDGLRLVVPHTGDVDRNEVMTGDAEEAVRVVPHTGDVDRNLRVLLGKCVPKVVPHTGDVDRNQNRVSRPRSVWRSSPIRGTWIEMARGNGHGFSVRRSSPIRGTWIEIRQAMPTHTWTSVVPHTGDVDRNFFGLAYIAVDAGRPPYGGRG